MQIIYNGNYLCQTCYIYLYIIPSTQKLLGIYLIPIKTQRPLKFLSRKAPVVRNIDCKCQNAQTVRTPGLSNKVASSSPPKELKGHLRGN